MKMLILMVLTLSLVSTMRISHLQSFFDDSLFPTDPIDDGSNNLSGDIPYFPSMTGVKSPITSIPVDNLTGQYQEIDQFIRESLPQLAGATLISITEQVVAGTRYCYTYEYQVYAEDGSSLGTTQNEYCVLSQPWDNDYLKLTTSDGSIFIKGGEGGPSATFSAVFLGPAQVDIINGTDTTTETKTI